MGDGTEQNPYTREDVLSFIKENGEKAEGLNLAGKTFEAGIDLRGCDLTGINLKGAIFQFAPRKVLINKGINLDSDEFTGAENIGALFSNAHLERADLRNTKVDKAFLSGTHLEGVQISGSNIYEAAITRAEWGNYKIGEEINKQFHLAEYQYRSLKQRYSNAGMYDVAGEFYFREREANRQLVQAELADSFKPAIIWKLIWLWIYKVLCGYGEKTFRVVVWATSIVFGVALVYFFICADWHLSSFFRCLYFSSASFISLGYGNWIDKNWINIDSDWIKGIGVAEAFAGSFLMALFLVTFTRKMIR